ncbi:MAG: hypothetical protein ACYTG6_07905 [Planctomycetota bacterium]|jgi:hypothetical protein
MKRQFIFAGALFVILGFVAGIAAAQTPWFRNGRYYLPARNLKPALEEILTEHKQEIDTLTADVQALQDLLADVVRITDPNTGQDTLRFGNAFGMNLQVVNGTGTTDGPTTGTGNLIIGYNELGHGSGDDRSGSHMLVVGTRNNYTGDSYGGIVVGEENETSNNYACVSGGFLNVASGMNAAVSGGDQNVASGFACSVSGGLNNEASVAVASVSGGQDNLASGPRSSVSGGTRNHAAGIASSVTGGRDNVAIVSSSSVTGGDNNTASGIACTVSGGQNRSVNGDFDWRAGTLFEND